jgi:hypothetical protein
MLLKHDNRTIWDGIDPDADPIVGPADADPQMNNDVEPAIDPEDYAPAALQLHSGLGVIPPTRGAQERTYQQYAHQALQNALITHFEYSYRRGCVVWPRGFTPQQRAMFPVLPPNVQSNVLYKAPSWYLARDENGEYTTDIGMGLFSCIKIPANTRLLRFIGDVRPRAEYDQRVVEGRGGYAIQLNAHTVLDCYDHKATCYASMVNSPRHLRSTKPELPQIPNTNCRIVVSNPVQGVVHLETTTAVAEHTELFWNYGPDYVYPAV